MASGLLRDDMIVDDANHLQWAFVSLKSVGIEDNGSSSNTQPSVTFSGYRILPHVLGVRLGQDLRVVNDDDSLHAIHIQGANASMATIQGHDSTRLPISFADSSAIRSVRCDIHPWEQAWIGIVGNSHFAVTGPDGSFEIRDVAPGEYLLEAWHERCHPVSRRINIRDGRPLTLDIAVDLER